MARLVLHIGTHKTATTTIQNTLAANARLLAREPGEASSNEVPPTDRVEISVRVPTGPKRVGVIGSSERNLKMLREALGVSITARDATVYLRGERAPVAIAIQWKPRSTSRRESEATLKKCQCDWLSS